MPGDDFYNKPRQFALNRDLNRLASLIGALGDCRLVILDPITAFLGDTSDQCNTDVWKLLSLLTRLAEKLQFAVLVVSHLRKKEGAAIHRAMGSLAFVASARTAWAIARDPADANKRLLLPIKNNLAPDAKGLAFTIASTDGAPVIRWSPDAVNVTTETLLLAPVRPRGRPDEERQFAIKWLQQHLADAPLPTRTVKEDAEAFGITYGTLRRAFRSLDGEAIRCGWPFKSWHWKLPGTSAQKYEQEFCASNYLDELVAELAGPWVSKCTPPATDQSPPPPSDSPSSGEDFSASAAGPPPPACHAPP